MRPVQIITDSCSDLPPALRQELEITVAPLAYVLNGTAYPDDSWEKSRAAEFFNGMRSGAAPTTTQVTTGTFTQIFTQAVQLGNDVLYIGFSSALSGTLNAAVLAKNSVLRNHPEANIIVIDSLAASLGLGLLVHEAVRRSKGGATINELATWVDEQKLNMNHWFTVGDLEYLRRGGRISNFASAVGSILQVKPILRFDNTGHIVPFSKVRGRKKSLDELARMCAERIDTTGASTIAISHGDCEPEARALEALIRAQVQVDQCIIHTIGPVIGSHAGPETLALFFWGHGRD